VKKRRICSYHVSLNIPLSLSAATFSYFIGDKRKAIGYYSKCIAEMEKGIAYNIWEKGGHF